MQVTLKEGLKKKLGYWRKSAPVIWFHQGVEYFIDDDCYDPSIMVQVATAEAPVEPVVEEAVKPKPKKGKKE